MKQIGIITEQVIDQPAGLRVTRQRAQQVLQCILPARFPATRDERSRNCALIGRAWDGVLPGAQEGVVESLVEEAEYGDAVCV
jgi:hypothetical protein